MHIYRFNEKDLGKERMVENILIEKEKIMEQSSRALPGQPTSNNTE